MSAMPVYNVSATGTLGYSITDNNWQFKQAEFESGLNFSPHMYAVQKGHQPLVYNISYQQEVLDLDRLVDVGNVPSGYAADYIYTKCSTISFW